MLDLLDLTDNHAIFQRALANLFVTNNFGNSARSGIFRREVLACFERTYNCNLVIEEAIITSLKFKTPADQTWFLLKWG
jgi:predicted aspartyl protease